MEGKIIGLNADVFYALVFLLLLVILGIVTFHYYVYITGGVAGGLRAGTGIGLSILPGRKNRPEQEQEQM